MTPTIPLTIIRFPDIHLETRDAHKLRGYFGTLFKEHSPLLHNHFEDGQLRYKYPLVQYKVVKEVPTLVGLNEGSTLLTELFLKVTELRVNGLTYPVHQKNLDHCQAQAGLVNELLSYRFENLWMALNQENHKRYGSLKNVEEKQILLNTVLKHNLLSFFKGINVWLDSPVMVKGSFTEHTTQFKNQPMLAFSGEFTTNALLPDLIGIGKAVSRGFGTILTKK